MENRTGQGELHTMGLLWQRLSQPHGEHQSKDSLEKKSQVGQKSPGPSPSPCLTSDCRCWQLTTVLPAELQILLSEGDLGSDFHGCYSNNSSFSALWRSKWKTAISDPSGNKDFLIECQHISSFTGVVCYQVGNQVFPTKVYYLPDQQVFDKGDKSICGTFTYITDG